VNAGPTAERVYETLKRAIMERGFRPGERLDPAVLADKLSASTTPVREALDRLVGEGLVETRTGSGFHLPALDEPGLKDMYAWSSELLALALRGWVPEGEAGASNPSESRDEESSVAERTSRLFSVIAARSSNREHALAVARLNARIHAVRATEPLALAPDSDELDMIEAAVNADDRAALRRLLVGYHRRRIRAAAAVVRALYRAG
jgi:DNA-binding GntR family transcriptional regulator